MLQGEGRGVIGKESGVRSWLAFHEEEWRQLLLGQCSGLRATCHTSLSKVRA